MEKQREIDALKRRLQEREQAILLLEKHIRLTCTNTCSLWIQRSETEGHVAPGSHHVPHHRRKPMVDSSGQTQHWATKITLSYCLSRCVPSGVVPLSVLVECAWARSLRVHSQLRAARAARMQMWSRLLQRPTRICPTTLGKKCLHTNTCGNDPTN